MLILLVCLVIFLAAFTQGLAGFGFALVAAPVLALLLTAKESVVLILGFTTFMNVYLLIRYRHQVELKKFWILVAFAPLGVVVGSVLLPHLSDKALSAMIAVMAVTTVSLLLTGRRLRMIKTVGAIRVAGFLSGFLNVTTGLGGTPPILLLEKQHVRKRRMIGDLAAYFLALNAFSVVGLLFAVGLSERTPMIFVSALPGAALGLVAGQVYCKRLRERQFHFAVLLLLLGGAVTALARSLSLI